MSMPGRGPALRLSVVVPFHRNLTHLALCLPAIQRSAARLPADAELADLIVVADGAIDDPAEIAGRASACVVPIDGPSGPAVARNRGAAQASGNVLVFVDADVVVHDDALARLAAALKEDPPISAVFGAYDDAPAERGFFSQARNLAHAFIHRRSSRNACTFWAGLGAVRADAFASISGFDERFTRPLVEDIDLGYRLTAAGHRIVLDARAEGQHLKRWTFRSSVVSDIRDRGVPWTQLLARYGAMADDLNITWRYRACVVAAYLLAAALAGAFVWPPLAAAAVALAAVLWYLDEAYYRFFVERRGWWMAVRWFPFHVLHHACNGVSFVAGNALYYLRRLTGLALPGSLPVDAWPARTASPREGAHVVAL